MATTVVATTVAVVQALKRVTNYEERNVEVDRADSDIDSDCTGDDAGSDVVHVKLKN